MATSRSRVQAECRKVFARHWIDPYKLSVASHQGTLRVSGELQSIGEERDALGASLLDALEWELCRVPDVKRVQLLLSNWSRNAHGAWVCLDRQPARPTPVLATARTAPKLVFESSVAG
jgi:hypothetical protein